MSDAQKQFLRFGILERIEHLVLIISFTTLSVTGLPQKYAQNEISQWAIGVLGGIETVRVLHRIAAAIFLIEAIYHLVIVGYKIYVQRKKATMVPSVKDGKDAIQWLGFNFGMAKERPRMPRYNFTEKMEYWAMLWGLILMGLTGLMLWNPIATTNILPGEFIPAAKAAHGAEAVLAVLAILLWHFYNVHVKHWNWGMIKGTLGHHEMDEEHGEELDEIKAGKIHQPPTAAQIRQRMMLFVPVAAVVSVVLVGLTIFFLSFEESALTTVPPISDEPVFVRPTATPTPTPTPVPVGEEGAAVPTTWDGGIDQLFADGCSSCHGSMGGFSAETYEDVVKAIQPGDPDASKVVEVQLAGHAGTFAEADLQAVIEWIKAGAPQQ